MESVREQLLRYVRETYRVEPDYPFPTAPEYPVLRHVDNRKWFALIMDVPRERLSLRGTGKVDIINLKCSAALSGTLRMQPGILPAYHMNREHWISVLLDGTVAPEDIYPLVDLSYHLTANR